MNSRAKAICMAISVAMACTWTTGCTNVKSVKASAECSHTMGGPTTCKAGVGVEWEPGGGQTIQAISEYETALPSAADVVLDVSGSTVALPSAGQVVVTLWQGSAILAAQQFGWSRSGSTLILSNPTAVDSWISGYSSSADKMTYELVPFSVGANIGLNTFAVDTKYQGQAVASASTTFCVAPKYPSPYQPMPCL